MAVDVNVTANSVEMENVLGDVNFSEEDADEYDVAALMEEIKTLKTNMILIQQQNEVLHNEVVRLRAAAGNNDAGGTQRKIPRVNSALPNSNNNSSNSNNAPNTSSASCGNLYNVNITNKNATAVAVKKKKILQAVNTNASNINKFLNKNKCNNITVKQSNIKSPVKISINNETDIPIIKQHLKKADVSFHEYKWEAEKMKSFIIKGLIGIDDSDLPFIKNNLILAGLPENISVSLYKSGFMRANPNNDHNTLILVTLPPNTDAQVLLNIKYIDHVVVKIEPLNNSKVLQCKNCQRFGHSASGCQHKHRCVKCGANHFKSDCPRTLNKNIKLICCNCSGEHTVNNLNECPVAQKFINKSIKVNNTSNDKSNSSNPTNIIKHQVNSRLTSNNNNRSSQTGINRFFTGLNNNNNNISDMSNGLSNRSSKFSSNHTHFSNSKNSPSFAQVVEGGGPGQSRVQDAVQMEVLNKLELLLTIVMKHEKLFANLAGNG